MSLPAHFGNLFIDSNDFVFETPISLASGKISGAFAFGAFSYAESNFQFHSAKVGRFCSIARDVIVGLGQDHPTGWLSTHPFQYGGGGLARVEGRYEGLPEYQKWAANQAFEPAATTTVIGNDVWIGDGAFIVGGVTVGDGALIAARTVVTKDVPPYAVVAGSPARVIRHRFSDELIARLVAFGWWNYDLSGIKDELDFPQPERCLALLDEKRAAGTLRPFAPARFRFDRSDPNAPHVVPY